MINRMDIVTLLKTVKDQVAANTGKKTLDTYPDLDEASPFYLIEFIASPEVKSKMLYVDDYKINVHCIGAVDGTRADIYKMVDDLRESLTDDITVPDGFDLMTQTCDGLTNIQLDETRELHAIVGFTFRIAYGFKSKN